MATHVCSAGCTFVEVDGASQADTYACFVSGVIHLCGDACDHIVKKDGRKVCELRCTPIRTNGTTIVCVAVGSDVAGIGDGSSKLRRDARKRDRQTAGCSAVSRHRPRRKPRARSVSQESPPSTGKVQVPVPVPVPVKTSPDTTSIPQSLELSPEYATVLALVSDLMRRERRARNAHAIAKTAQAQADTVLRAFISSQLTKGVVPSVPECLGVFYEKFSACANGIDAEGAAELPPDLADAVVRGVLHNWALYVTATRGFGLRTSKLSSTGGAAPPLTSSGQPWKLTGFGSMLTLHDFALGALLVMRDAEVARGVPPHATRFQWVPTDTNVRAFKKSNANKLLPLQQSVRVFMRGSPTAVWSV
jgi:hypothetical protein